MSETLEATPDQTIFWSNRYQQQTTPWDLGKPTPPLVAWVENNLALIEPNQTLAVVGCGRGHDASFFGQHGFHVTGFDFAPEAIAFAKTHYGSLAQFVELNILDLPSAYEQQFDWVVEHTCYCAIRPKDRPQYSLSVYKMLKPGGHLLGLFWAHRETGGPPYHTSPEDLNQNFSPYFDCLELGPTSDSVAERLGQELIGYFKKKAL